MAERSKKLIQVGFYLSKYGKLLPPSKLRAKRWYEAYNMFYKSLNGGRSTKEFEHSLKNSRDSFDSYFPETNREGWKEKETGEPARLSGFAADVYNEFNDKNEEYIWTIVSKYLD